MLSEQIDDVKYELLNLIQKYKTTYGKQPYQFLVNQDVYEEIKNRFTLDKLNNYRGIPLVVTNQNARITAI